MSSRAKYKTNNDRLLKNPYRIWESTLDENCEINRIRKAFEDKGHSCFISSEMGNDLQYYNCIEINKGYVPIEPILDFLGSQRIDMEIHYLNHHISILLQDYISADELINKIKRCLPRRESL